MGKHGDQKASGTSGLCKEDLKVEHARLVTRDKALATQYEEVKAIFQKLEETYQSSKGTFSIQRYGQLKDMIKAATSNTTIQGLQLCIQDLTSSGDAGSKGGITSLLSKAKELSQESQQQAEVSKQATASSRSGGKVSSFMKRLKDMTGFSNEPITDEDVMSEGELRRDCERKKRSIQHHLTQCSKALKKLEKLKLDYEASKSHAPPKRYQELKDMIKAAVADKFT